MNKLSVSYRQEPTAIGATLLANYVHEQSKRDVAEFEDSSVFYRLTFKGQSALEKIKEVRT